MHLRLRPEPHGRFGSPLEGEWRLDVVDDQAATLRHLPTGAAVRLALDHIHNYTTDPSGRTGGFLVLHSYVRQLQDGQFEVVPIVPRIGEEAPKVRLTQEEFGELAMFISRIDEALKQMVRESASERSRENASRSQAEAEAWIANHVGPAAAASFMAAAPDLHIPAGFPAEYAGLHQRMRGRLTYLLQLTQRLER